ncbi:hypothetical protein D5R81_06975 [Parashewanella spongiae]|uniref:Uncharacterized protein n=1 Tax=Parashewanella spongiae TaxID=342950 RepID=A0A3A6TPZ8_9GAMM|nr:hypothetical protein D5R81_06975 [Parashewanella spongiae]
MLFPDQFPNYPALMAVFAIHSDFSSIASKFGRVVSYVEQHVVSSALSKPQALNVLHYSNEHGI